METALRYWITVVSKDHLTNGIAGGFMQANHGKAAPLKKMHPADWVIFYSPKQNYKGTDVLQAFTAIGQVVDHQVYQHKMTDDFIPYRRNIKFYECREVSITPLINDLEFIVNKQSWGYPFRFGFFEIQQADFDLLRSSMIDGKLKTTDQINS